MSHIMNTIFGYSYHSCYCHLREFVNYRHPDPRRGKPRVRSTRPESISGGSGGSAGSGGSGSELREVTFYAQASQTLHILTEQDAHFWLFLSNCLFLFDFGCCGCVRLVKLVSKKPARASNVTFEAQISKST